MRFLRYSLAGLFLIAMTGALLVYAGALVYRAVETRMNEEPRPTRSRERIFAVSVEPAQVGQEQPVLTTFGQIESARILQLRAAASGTVLELSEKFVDGGAVDANEILVRIDPSEAQNARDRAASDLADARLEQDDAVRAIELARDELAAAKDQAELRQRAFERQKSLAERGVGTSASVETAELAASSARQAVLTRRQALAQAEGRVSQAATRITRAQLAEADAQRRLDNTVIKADFAGTLSDVTIVEGGLVSNNERLANLVDPDRLEVSFRISTAQYARLLDENGKLNKADVTVILDVFGADLKANGKISRDSAAVGEGLSGRLLFATLNEAHGFKPGDFVRVEVIEPPVNDVVRLPATALGADGNLLVLGDEDRLEAFPVTLVRRQGDDVLVRAQGLNGRDVVIARTPLLGAGIKVKPLHGSEASEIKEPETVALTPERKGRLVASIEANKRIPDEARSRILATLEKDRVPAALVERLEARMNGAPASSQGQGGDADMITLSPDRKARIIAFVESNDRMPADIKARVLAQLQGDQVPAQVVQRIESRMGG